MYSQVCGWSKAVHACPGRSWLARRPDVEAGQRQECEYGADLWGINNAPMHKTYQQEMQHIFTITRIVVGLKRLKIFGSADSQKL